MAHKLRVDSVFSVEVRLKGKDYDHLVHPSGDLPDPASTPCPNLGTDVIYHGNTKIVGDLGDPEVEIRKIDEYYQVGTAGLEFPADAEEGSQDEAQFVEDFQPPNHGECSAVEEGFHPLLAQRGTANTGNLGSRGEAVDFLHQPGPMFVS